jgi:hypothetical protein
MSALLVLATADEATGTFARGAVAFVAAAVLLWIGRPGASGPIGWKALSWLVAAVLLLVGAVFVLFGFAIAGCPPDAYECPI